MKQIAPMEVGIPVIDLARMHAFYCNVLGCTEVRRADIPADLSRAIRTVPDGYLNVWLQTPNSEVIKLMQPTAPPESVTPAQFSADRTGIAYLTFYCNDLDATLAAAEAAGAQVRSDPSARSGDLGVRLVFFEDPEGNVIELVEPSA